MNDMERVGQKLLLAFQGKEITPEMEQGLVSYRPGGVTFFRSFNIDNPAQFKTLIDSLKLYAENLGLPPLLFAVDQEGGQLMAIGEGTTPLPGNMALGAAGSIDLAKRAGEVLGRELAAMGINMNYAPCCDVNINPLNPVIGTRSFGEDPAKVAALSAAMIDGMQSQGVAAVAKHFPGHGDTASDSHHGLPSLSHDLDRLRKVEFLPFQAAIRADVKLIMSAHLALPAIDGENAPPATLSSAVLRDVLRQQLGFEGATVSDAMDMRAIRQGEHLSEECARAASAGIDLLLITADPADHKRAWQGLSRAINYNESTRVNYEESIDRIEKLKTWLTDNKQSPGLDVVGCAEHLAVADEISQRSITLVRDDAHLLPLKLDSSARVTVILPQPTDLTPADTSSYIFPQLANAISHHHANVEEILIPFAPEPGEMDVILKQVGNSALVLFGTINAVAGTRQAELAQILLQTGVPVIMVAMRLPYDLTGYPDASTYLCTYSIQEPSMKALSGILFGQLKPQGRLPVSIPAMYPLGHGLT